jgi:hypothetical protein
VIFGSRRFFLQRDCNVSKERQDESKLKRWEYRFERVLPDKPGQEKLTELGRQGWRVIEIIEPRADPSGFQVLLERRLSDVT